MMNTDFASSIEQLIAQLPVPIMKMKEHPEKRGALLYAGPTPDVSKFSEWIEKALWMLENSAVATRTLPAGKFVALAYKGGYIVVSADIKDALSEEIRNACNVVTYDEFDMDRAETCLVFTKCPFELSVVFDGETCMVFLAGNPEADIVIHSPERLRQIMLQ